MTVTLPELSPYEELAAQAYQDVSVSAVIRPAAVLSEPQARLVVRGLAAADVSRGGTWSSTPVLWQRWDRSWDGPHGSVGSAQLVGALQVTVGAPRRFEITVYRATVTLCGTVLGWSLQTLCDEALGFAGLTLDSCPRTALPAPPPVLRFA
jgi:hypothetical protein